MAEASRENLKAALATGLTTATGAVRGTMEITNIAVTKATGITKSAVNAAGVLGEQTVGAAETIGKAAIGAGADLTGKSLEAVGKVGSTAIGVGADVTEKSLQAAATITNAATSATTDIATTALDTGASVVTTTTEQVGNALEAGVNLAGNSVTRTLKGIDNIGAMVAGRGALTVQSTLQKQAAQSTGIAAAETKVNKDMLLKAFDEVQKQSSAAVGTLHGVQKTALAGRINIYKRAKCGFFRRLVGACDAGTISKDMALTDLFLNEFKTAMDTASQQAKAAIASAPDGNLATYQTIEINYNVAVAAAVKKFVGSYASLLEKYDKLARQALGVVGGRRRRSVRKLRKQRKTRRR